MTLDDNLKIIALIDVYGELLTDRQREIMYSYYFDNLSLSEIGENMGVSRQAINDCINQSARALENFEDKLKIVDFKSTLRRDLLELKENTLTGNNLDLINKILQKL